ncbi:hypothetical protein [Nocardiopsis halotolerans]|uniref:hypothetical protein n=1 Tax=Nocardiopsis halotolerans TaxID=124252 RepID=UPI0003792180|nr:hypothetical protein [Nocardiopsis halotolerans]
MIKDRKRRKAMRRVKAGNGRPLKRFRAWQPLSRALLYLPLTNDDGRQVVYAVDVPYWQQVLTEDGGGRAHLHLDGRHHAESTLPAVFPVPGGTIEVVSTVFGLKRCHYVTEEGAVHQLIPDRRSAEGRRARLDREHPALSRWIGGLSLLMLIVPLTLVLLQVLEAVAQIPPVTQRFGAFAPPVDPPTWLNVALGLCAAVASVERATRLRWNAFLDGSG